MNKRSVSRNVEQGQKTRRREGFRVQWLRGGVGVHQLHSRLNTVHEGVCVCACGLVKKSQPGAPWEPGPRVGVWMEVRKGNAAEGERTRVTVIQTVQSAA